MNIFGYEIKVIPNKIKKSQYMTKKAIEACKTLEEFEEFINSLQEVQE